MSSPGLSGGSPGSSGVLSSDSADLFQELWARVKECHDSALQGDHLINTILLHSIAVHSIMSTKIDMHRTTGPSFLIALRLSEVVLFHKLNNDNSATPILSKIGIQHTQIDKMRLAAHKNASAKIVK